MRTPRHSGTRGFSLVELMVGIVIAMAAVIVVTRIFKDSENMRRATTGGDDASTTGAVALSMIQRDLRQAGQGFVNPSLLDCQLTLGTGSTLSHLVPAIINPSDIPEGDDGSDVLVISYGSGWGSPEGDSITSQPSAAAYNVDSPQTFQSGDRVIATVSSRPTPCAAVLTTVVGAPAAGTVNVAFGVANVSAGSLFNLGRQPRFVAYAIRSSRLTMCDFLTQKCNSADPDNWTEVADNVVGLRAQYGRDTGALRTGLRTAPYDQVTPTSVCAWSRVVGLRMVLVVRNRQPDKEEVTTAVPTWSADSDAPISVPGEDWKYYRYRTFETTVPFRNVPQLSDDLHFTSC